MMFNSKIFVRVFSFYLGLSPVFWVPHISPALFLFAKSVFFIYIVLFVFFSSAKINKSYNITFPGGLYVLYALLVMLVIVLIYSFVGGDESAFIRVVNFLQVILFLLAVRVLIYLGKVLYVIKLSLFIISFFVILSVVAMMLFPLEVSPFNNKLHLIDTGFGGLRTGWAPSIGLFLPFLIILPSGFILIFVYLFSQLLTGGRAGFYLSVLAAPVLLFYRNTWRVKTGYLLIIIAASLIVYIYDPSYFSEFRAFDSLISNESGLDDFGSGRVTLLKDAWASILKSPLIGSGMYSSFPGDSVHNVFVRGWVYYGFIYFALSFSVVIYILIKAISRIRSSKNKENKTIFFILFVVLFSGFLIGMVEPLIIFGNFTTFSVWWFSFALVASKDFFLLEGEI